VALSYLAGILLGLGLILPIGAQNVFVIGQGVAVGLPRALWAAVAAALCDCLLILLGAAGAAALLARVPPVRLVMLAAGAAFLYLLGIRALRASSPEDLDVAGARLRPRHVVARTAAVSLLNPHAILDTVGVIGAAISAQPSAHRLAFGVGTATASWLWFLVLAVAASALRRVLTPARRVWFDRTSGLIMVAFGTLLVVELVRAVLG
jgi:L-lysine exporter family protein LysE/ArgO